jgi:hypothetical protein
MESVDIVQEVEMEVNRFESIKVDRDQGIENDLLIKGT